MSEDAAVRLLAEGIYPSAYNEAVWLEPGQSESETMHWAGVMVNERRNTEAYARQLLTLWRSRGVDFVEPA